MDELRQREKEGKRKHRVRVLIIFGLLVGIPLVAWLTFLLWYGLQMRAFT